MKRLWSHHCLTRSGNNNLRRNCFSLHDCFSFKGDLNSGFFYCNLYFYFVSNFYLLPLYMSIHAEVCECRRKKGFRELVLLSNVSFWDQIQVTSLTEIIIAHWTNSRDYITVFIFRERLFKEGGALKHPNTSLNSTIH